MIYGRIVLYLNHIHTKHELMFTENILYEKNTAFYFPKYVIEIIYKFLIIILSDYFLTSHLFQFFITKALLCVISKVL